MINRWMLRIRLWWHDVCPAHGPMLGVSGAEDGIKTCLKCTKHRRAKLQRREGTT